MGDFFLWYYAFENMVGEFGHETTLESNHCGTIYFNTMMNDVEVWLEPDRLIENEANVVFNVWVKDGSNRKIQFNLRDNTWEELNHWVSLGVEMPQRNKV